MIFTSSVNSKHPMPSLLAYSATKGALSNMVLSLAQLLAEKGIRVNGVLPGPIWTPFIPSGMEPGFGEVLRLAGAVRPPGPAGRARLRLRDAGLRGEQLHLGGADHRRRRDAGVLSRTAPAFCIREHRRACHRAVSHTRALFEARPPVVSTGLLLDPPEDTDRAPRRGAPAGHGSTRILHT